MNKEEPELNPFKAYCVFHFISIVQVFVFLLLFESSKVQMFQPFVFMMLCLC
jgi:hypothetical protein